MRTIEVPGTDLTISQLVLGTMSFGMQVDEAAAGRMGVGGRFSQEGLGAMYRERYWRPDLFAAISDLTGITEQAGLTLVELVLRWLQSRPQVGAVLLGASRVEQLEANVSAARGPALSIEVIQAGEPVWQQLRGPAPSYNR